MSWRDRIKGEATFRGVPFFVETAEHGGGRRNVTHEFPGRSMPYVEDTGRAARTFPVDAYVLGDDYLEKKNALLAALEEEGPGELVHPYYGTRRVSLTAPFRVRESVGDGGMARFSLEFTETEATPSAPVATIAAGAQVLASADAALAALGEAFLAAYQVTGLPRTALSSVTAVLSSAVGAVGTALAHFVRDAQALAGLRRDLDDLAADAETVVRQPSGLLASLGDAFAALGGSPFTPELGLQALLAAYAFTPSEPRPPATTSVRRQEQASYDALLRLVRGLAVVHAARLAPDGVYDSYDAAVAMRDAIAEKLDAEMEVAADGAFAGLEQLRADLVRAVPGEETDLPRLVTYVPPYTVPSLVLAHRLYGDVAREADIVARNGIAHPGFVVGGTELEVLSRA